MRLVFTGLSRPVDIEAGYATVLQVENAALFARIARSLQLGTGEEALEPFTLWDGDNSLRFKDRCLFIPDPLNLPWDDKRLLGEVVKRIEREFLEDEDLRQRVERAERELTSSLFGLSLGLDSSYGFDMEWDFRRYLKMLGFRATVQPSESYLDNLMEFISFVLDSGLNKALVFVNLKTFLTENDVEKLYEHVFYTKMMVLMVENKTDLHEYNHERKRVIDQDFLEY